MPVTGDDQFQMALERELADVVASEDLAGRIIGRHRRGRRRRFAAGVCSLLAVAAVALGLTTTTQGPVELRLTGYTLKLPAGYHPARDARSPCQVVAVLPGRLGGRGAVDLGTVGGRCRCRKRSSPGPLPRNVPSRPIGPSGASSDSHTPQGRVHGP